jgi:hypothetical protein
MAQRETVLPRTVVPDYLDETPLAVQVRHEETFDLGRAPLNQAGDTPRFPRPGMLENMQLLESNLALHGGYYFDMRWRKVETLV